MNIFTNHRRAWAIVGALAGVVLLVGGVLLFVSRHGPGTQTGQPPATTVPTTVPTTGPITGTMTVTVYFHRGELADPATVVPVTRTVPRTNAVATAALNQLLAGPTAAERSSGYWSFFSSSTAGMLRSLRIGNGIAHADFHDFSHIIPNASSSAGSAALLAELDTTLRQFPTVSQTVYSFDGNVSAFYEWLQMVPPTGNQGDRSRVISTARDFLTRVVGMTNPASGPLRWMAPGQAVVDFYARSPANGQPMTAIVTTVALRQGNNGWFVTGTTTPQILVDHPVSGQTVTSPVPVSGQAIAFEGVVTVRVVQIAGTKVQELGHGSVTGGGDMPRPFSGQITFTAPTSGAGWLLFFELSAANGDVLRATSVPVAFAGQPAAPVVLGVRATPNLPVASGWLMLPGGAGRVTFTATATGADRVRFYLMPTGTETGPPTLIGEGLRTGNDFAFEWKYADQPLLSHLTVVATGPGGQAEVLPFNVYHG